VEVLVKLDRKSGGSPASVKSRHSSWNDFDHHEYRERVYGRQILEEDRRLIWTCIDLLEERIATCRRISNYLDIGSGPNLYPSMLMMPWIEENSTISLLDYASPNVSYLESIMRLSATDDAVVEWVRFEQLMQSYGGSRYGGALERILSEAKVGYGDIFDLPAETYDAVTAFFVAESITGEVSKFEQATASLINSVKPGGLIVTAHVVGSEGWYAGSDTNFPAVFLTERDLEHVYSVLPAVTVTTFMHGDSPAARKGYQGLALVVATKPALPIEESRTSVCQ
jgi:16S rRNA G527 N7-methylase RsmG